MKEGEMISTQKSGTFALKMNKHSKDYEGGLYDNAFITVTMNEDVNTTKLQSKHGHEQDMKVAFKKLT